VIVSNGTRENGRPKKTQITLDTIRKNGLPVFQGRPKAAENTWTPLIFLGTKQAPDPTWHRPLSRNPRYSPP